MKLIKLAPLFLAVVFCSSLAFAKADPIEQFTDATMTGDVATLEKILAPNFWYIGVNGHIRDKEHFIDEIKNKQLVINRISLLNNRETQIGTTRLVTANGEFQGHFTRPIPNGMMRFTTVVADNKGTPQIVLFQGTPVIATPDCKDGNCQIK